MADIKQIIDGILKEPIGKHFCDSGGAYGYIYERNQKDGYLKGLNPVDEYTDEDSKERTLEITIPVYDFLTYNLIKDEDTENLEKDIFNALANENINSTYIFEVSDWLKTSGKALFGIEDTGITSLDYTNTYNSEEFISQTLLYVCFSQNGDDYTLLEVHNGCDVRSGYTDPQLFKLKDVEYFIMGQFDRFCQCECGLNDYTIYGSDDPTDSDGDYISKNEIYNRTYIDNEGNVRCKKCNEIIEGGFREW